jgi:hypothetical protein
MEEGSRKIKRYSEFMPKKGFTRMMDQIEVSGTIKRGFLSRPRVFEMQVYFTPMKKRIVNIITSGVDLRELNLPFSIGDNIEEVRKWVKENNYKIVVEINR